MGQFITVKRTEKFTFLQSSHTFYPLHVLPPLAEFPVVTNDFFARLRPLCGEKWRAHSNRLKHLHHHLPSCHIFQFIIFFPHLFKKYKFALKKLYYVLGTSKFTGLKMIINRYIGTVKLIIVNKNSLLFVLVINPFCHFWRDKQ